MHQPRVLNRINKRRILTQYSKSAKGSNPSQVTAGNIFCRHVRYDHYIDRNDDIW